MSDGLQRPAVARAADQSRPALRDDPGGHGWELRILALGDVEADGEPDCLFSIGGPNASRQALVLSSLAKPGRNPPTAYLAATGC